MTTTRLRILGGALSAALLIAWLAPQAPRATMAAGTVLTVAPVTWNVVGLDSNNPAVGPNTYPVGARICNTSPTTLTNVVATFAWDSTDTRPGSKYIDMSSASASSLTVVDENGQADLAPTACTDVYYTVAIVPSKAAIGTARRYAITVTADGGVSGSTPMPREIYVQGLNSQSRNSVTSISGPQNVSVGQTVQYVVHSQTSSTFDQLSDFLNFPNTLFKVVSIAAAYQKPAGATNDKEYADACGWDPDPTSPGYLSCVNSALYPALYPGGVGGTIVTTYTVQAVANGSFAVSDAIIDDSGNSYHYNSDYGVLSVPVTIGPPPTATPTNTPTATATPTNTPTATPTDTPTDTPTATATPTDTSTDTPTNTPTATPTDTPTNTPTATAMPTDTPMASATPTDRPTATATPGLAKTGALTMGFWHNKNGQGIITNGALTSGVCNSGTWLWQYAPFQDLSATATCSPVATYVYNVIKTATCSGPTTSPCNAMLKAQMLATALDVYFSDPTLGGNQIKAPAPLGGVTIDLTHICHMIDGANGTAKCSGTFENVSSAFGGATSLTVSQMLTVAASYSNVGGTIWYGNVKATQVLAKDAFDAINNQVAFSP